MLTYLLTYFFVGSSSYLICRNKIDKKKKALIICAVWFIAMVLLFGLRHPSMGNDLHYGYTNGYLGEFEYIASLSFKELFTIKIANYEIGFVLFNKLISFLGTNYQYYLFMCTIFALFPISYIVYKYSENPFMSFVIYMGLPVFMMVFSGMRQIISIGICTFALKFIIDKKLIKFLLCIGLATLFHYTSFIFFLAYPIYRIRFNMFGRLISLGIIGIIFAFRNQLFFILATLFKSEPQTNDSGAFTLFIVFVFVYVFCFVFMKKDDVSNGLLNIFYLTCLCQAFSGISDLAMRIGYYFMPTIAKIMPKIINDISDNNTKLFAKIVIPSAFVVFALWSIYNSTWEMAYPYHFFWEI